MQNSIVTLKSSEVVNVSGGVTIMSASISVASAGIMMATLGFTTAAKVATGIFFTGLASGVASYSTYGDLDKATKAMESKIVQLVTFADMAIAAKVFFNFHLNGGINGFLNPIRA